MGRRKFPVFPIRRLIPSKVDRRFVVNWIEKRKEEKQMKGKVAALLLALSFLPVSVQAVQEERYALVLPETGERYAYVTPFAVSHTILGRDGSVCNPRLYRLAGEQDVVGYSGNGAEELQSGVRYWRRNLEDSTFFSNTTAGKLRAILRKGYPERSVGEIQACANDWLEEMGLSVVRELQSGEAILAAQIAIWKLVGGNGYSVNALYSGAVDVEDLQSEGVNDEELHQQETEHTAKNIELLYAYFYNMEPMAPSVVLASDASITRTVYACVQDPEGGYNATVSVTVNAEEGLLLTASCEGQTQEQVVTGAGEYSFPFSGLNQRSAVKLVLHGMQYGADVYLFEAEGNASQILLGYYEGVLPVYSERVLTPVPSNTKTQ